MKSSNRTLFLLITKLGVGLIAPYGFNWNQSNLWEPFSTWKLFSSLVLIPWLLKQVIVFLAVFLATFKSSLPLYNSPRQINKQTNTHHHHKPKTCFITSWYLSIAFSTHSFGSLHSKHPIHSFSFLKDLKIVFFFLSTTIVIIFRELISKLTKWSKLLLVWLSLLHMVHLNHYYKDHILDLQHFHSLKLRARLQCPTYFLQLSSCSIVLTLLGLLIAWLTRMLFLFSFTDSLTSHPYYIASNYILAKKITLYTPSISYNSFSFMLSKLEPISIKLCTHHTNSQEAEHG